MMKLYKYIGFDKEYCDYIANENSIRFATIKELQGGNDKTELFYDLDTKSSVINDLNGMSELDEVYKSGFNSTAILSTATEMNSRLWNEYCPSGGFLYEFTFNPKSIKDISHNYITYSNNKNYNAWSYLINNEKDSKYKRLLRYEGGVTDYDRVLFLKWLKNPQTEKMMSDHITKEIVLKKNISFEYESEYRFTHLLHPIGHLKELKTNLINQKANLREVGLELSAIHTNDIPRAKQNLLNINIPMYSISFTDSN